MTIFFLRVSHTFLKGADLAHSLSLSKTYVINKIIKYNNNKHNT